jgi:hypothetical protein
VKEVTLNYSNSNGTWTNVIMSYLGGNIWTASIPAFPYDTNIKYMIAAQDNAENTIATLSMGDEYQYKVVPEFSAVTIALLLFMTSALLAVALHTRKRFTGASLAPQKNAEPRR